MHWRRFDAGQTILHYRDNRRAVFFVVQGRASVLYHSASGREVRFGDLQAGTSSASSPRSMARRTWPMWSA